MACSLTEWLAKINSEEGLFLCNLCQVRDGNWYANFTDYKLGYQFGLAKTPELAIKYAYENYKAGNGSSLPTAERVEYIIEHPEVKTNKQLKKLTIEDL